ncbi:MAG: 30S ribosomal protein S12 methylthiotransferase RimO [Abditibacteriota bacterium]|nr:30S ribosomal protein S12 methylthiotransferase RimO [Abditibacteriota bacterium]
MKIALITFGCPKNLVDAENMLGTLAAAGHVICGDPEDADIIVVNTCGVIESARAESNEGIREALDYGKKVIVIGCLAQRFPERIKKDFPEVAAVLGIDRFEELAATVDKLSESDKAETASEPAPRCWVEPRARLQSTPPHTAYIKVSDGCDNRCAYCAIPDIRGSFRSRPEEKILEEAKTLSENGVKELILVGQDLTDYGKDTGTNLAALLRKLCAIESVRYIRPLYCYPSKIDDDLIEALAESPKVLHYMDIPIQHGDDEVLRRMGRRGTAKEYLEVIAKIRRRMPDFAIRSTFIVGFPGETEENFSNLLTFVRKAKLDRAGAFVYSPEEGTRGAEMEGKVSPKTAEKRLDRLMKLQYGITAARNGEFAGKPMAVIVEGYLEEGGVIGRSYRDAPEIDGLVIVPDAPETELGAVITAEITEADGYDLYGRYLKTEKI